MHWKYKTGVSYYLNTFFLSLKNKNPLNFSELINRDLGHSTEKAMAPHSSTFAWKIPWTEEPGGLQSMGSLESDTTERPPFHFSLSCTGEGNGNPLQCFCLENPRDGEAWWAAVSGVTQSRTWLKRLSSSSSSSSRTFQSKKKPTSVSNGNIQKPLQVTQMSTCPET